MILSLYENIRVSENQYSRINYEVISEGYFLFVNFQSKAKNYLGRPNNTYMKTTVITFAAATTTTNERC